MSMVQTYDVGSLPFQGDINRFCGEATVSVRQTSCDPASIAYFEDFVVKGFVDKVRAGLSVANYPQFRDMNEMFLELMDGVSKTSGGYVAGESISIRPDALQIPEVAVLERRSKEIYEKVGGPFSVKICVSGPYTLSSLFVERESSLFSIFSELLSKLVERNIFRNRYGEVKIVAVDEPVFGFLDDHLLDFGSEDREVLLKSWEKIFYAARSKSSRTCIHLHNTTNEMFWDIGSLDVVESHVDDPIYRSSRVKMLLEKKDKLLKASLCNTDFDRLIRNSLLHKMDEAAADQKIGGVWTDIRRGKIKPERFLETAETMKARLLSIVKQFGAERVPYAGPECGLKSFPTYESAIEYLQRAAKSVGTSSI